MQGELWSRGKEHKKSAVNNSPQGDIYGLLSCSLTTKLMILKIERWIDFSKQNDINCVYKAQY